MVAFKLPSGIELMGKVMFSLPGRERKSVIDSEAVDAICDNAEALDRQRTKKVNDRIMENISTLCTGYVFCSVATTWN